MPQKNLIILAGTLIVFAGFAYWTTQRDQFASTVKVPDIEVPADEVSTITIESTDLNLTVVRQEEGWRLTAPIEGPADTVTVSNLMQGLEEVSLETIVSTNPDRYSNFEVDDSAIRVTMGWEDEQQTFVVGKSGPDFQSFYTRLDDDPRVFLAKGRLNAPTNLDRWRDRTVINVPKLDVESATVSTPAGDFQLAYAAGAGWAIQQGTTSTAADSANVMTWLTRYAPLKGLSFLADAEDVQANSTHRITFRTTGGSEHHIWLQSREEDLALVSSLLADPVKLNATQLTTYFPDQSFFEVE